MSEFRVGLRYAKSLIGFAEEQGKLEDVKDDIERFAKVYRENKDFEIMLRSPVISDDKKHHIIHDIFEDKFNQITLKFFDIVIRKNRAGYLKAIAESFIDQYYELKNIDQVTVTTTFRLDEDLRDKFKKAVKNTTGREVLLKEKIDKSLIGGYVIRLGDKQVDDSVKSKIRRIAFSFSDKSFEKKL